MSQELCDGINMEELKEAIKECAKEIKKKGEVVTEDALVEMLMIKPVCARKAGLKKAVKKALDEIRVEKEQAREDKLSETIGKCAKRIVDNGEKLSVAGLVDSILPMYLYMRDKEIKDANKNVVGKETVQLIDMVKFDKDCSLIRKLIEDELGKRMKEDSNVREEIILGWKSIADKYSEMSKGVLAPETLWMLIRDIHFGNDIKGQARFMIEEPYVSMAVNMDKAYLEERKKKEQEAPGAPGVPGDPR